MKLLTIILCVAIAICGCVSNNVTYKTDSGSSMTLHANTYQVIQPDGPSFDGRYTIDNDTLYLFVPFGSIKLHRCKKGWIDNTGEVWKKE